MQECYHPSLYRTWQEKAPPALPDSAAWISRVWKRLPCLCACQKKIAVSCPLLSTGPKPTENSSFPHSSLVWTTAVWSNASVCGPDYGLFVTLEKLACWNCFGPHVAGLPQRSLVHLHGSPPKAKASTTRKLNWGTTQKLEGQNAFWFFLPFPHLVPLQFNKAFLIWRQLFLVFFQTWRIEGRKPGLLHHHVASALRDAQFGIGESSPCLPDATANVKFREFMYVIMFMVHNMS